MKYKYVGEGAGVPGLPHEISDEDAEALGVTQLLADAIANGSYLEDKPSAGDAHAAPSSGSAEGSQKKSKRLPVVIEEDKPWLAEPKQGEE